MIGLCGKQQTKFVTFNSIIYVQKGDNLIFKRKLYPLVVFFGEYGQKTLQVDYSSPVHKVMDLIWKAFSVTPKKDNEFSLRRLSPGKSRD